MHSLYFNWQIILLLCSLNYTIMNIISYDVLTRAIKICLMGVIKMNTVMQVLNPYSPIIYLLIAWSIIWKGIALWHSSRNKQLVWFIIILIVNTVGILEIVYLIFFKKRTE